LVSVELSHVFRPNRRFGMSIPTLKSTSKINEEEHSQIAPVFAPNRFNDCVSTVSQNLAGVRQSPLNNAQVRAMSWCVEGMQLVRFCFCSAFILKAHCCLCWPLVLLFSWCLDCDWSAVSVRRYFRGTPPWVRDTFWYTWWCRGCPYKQLLARMRFRLWTN